RRARLVLSGRAPLAAPASASRARALSRARPGRRGGPDGARAPDAPRRGGASGAGVLEAAGHDGVGDRAAEVGDDDAEDHRRAGRLVAARVEDRAVLGIGHHARLHPDTEDVARRERDVLAVDAAFADLGDAALQADAEGDRGGIRDAEALGETGDAQRSGGAGGELGVAIRAAELLLGGGAGVVAPVAARGLGERAAA